MPDNNTNIADIKNKVADFINKRNWNEAHSPKNLAMSISIEAAELMEIFQWMSIEESKEIRDNPEKFTHLKEELADVLIYAFSLANQLDIDVAEAIEDKSIKNAIKYPEAKDNALS